MTITLEELRRIVREEVRRVLLEAFLELVSAVDEEEQREVERIAGKPSDYSEEEFIDWSGE